MKVSKIGESINFEDKDILITAPSSAIIAMAEDGTDRVSIKLKASRKVICGFLYQDMTPKVANADEAVKYISYLI